MNLQANFSTLWKLCLMALFAVTLIFSAPVNNSFAQNNTANSQVTNILCNAVAQVTGPIGRAIAILIIVSLAIALFLGKVSWGMAIAVAVGMGILFGAKDVVSLLSGNSMC